VDDTDDRLGQGRVRDLIVVGAGPAGLAVAIAARQAGLDCQVLEKGLLVNSIFRFPRNMTFFTTPELLEIGGLPFVTPYEKPTQWEALRYYRRVAEAFELKLALGVRVLGIERRAEGFGVAVRDARGQDETLTARRVVVATGYYDTPNLLGVPGEDLPHVTHYYDEPHPWYRKDVLVVGGKNSAAIAALELHRAGARVTLVHRRSRPADSIKYWIRPDLEHRLREGAIAARFDATLTEIRPHLTILRSNGHSEEVPAEGVFLMTGYHPDTSLLRGAGVEVDPVSQRPTHDPRTLETDVAGLFVAGALAAGRETSRIFIENGRFHGEAIVAALRGRQSGG
jgi:thioredoxin reductase (NADPH)